MMGNPDAVAVRPVRGSAAVALDAAFASRRRELVALCRPIVGDDAEDIVHDAYLRARTRLDQLRDDDLAGAWIAKIAINLCFQKRRRRDALARLLPRLLVPPKDRDEDLRGAITRLPTTQRTVVTLFYGEGLDVASIARLLDQNPATVRSLLHRARRRLRAAIELRDE